MSGYLGILTQIPVSFENLRKFVAKTNNFGKTIPLFGFKKFKMSGYIGILTKHRKCVPKKS